MIEDNLDFMYEEYRENKMEYEEYKSDLAKMLFDFWTSWNKAKYVGDTEYLKREISTNLDTCEGIDLEIAYLSEELEYFASKTTKSYLKIESYIDKLIIFKNRFGGTK